MLCVEEPRLGQVSGEQKVSGDGTWYLKGDGGFEQEHPERHLQQWGPRSAPW